VTHPYKTSQLVLSLLISVSLMLSGCLSLSEDITPPPGDAQPTSDSATQRARPTSTQVTPVEPQPTPGDGDGVVTVEIVDQTGGSLPQEELEVRLEGYDQFELTYQVSQPAENSGLVVFSGVPLEPGRIFFASIEYSGAVYRSEIVEIAEDTSSLDLPIWIFETTTDGSGLLIDRVHVLLEFLQPGLVNVVEIYIFSNLGDTTVVAQIPGDASVFFPLPAQAGSIEFDDGVLGQRYLLTEDGFGDTVSIPPGDSVYQVLVYYSLPYQGNKLDFKQSMAYPVGAVVVMTPAGNITVKGSDLEDLGVQDISGGAVQVFSGSSIACDGNLEFRISGKPESTAGQENLVGGLSQTVLIAIGVAGGLLFLTGIVLFLRNRRRNELDRAGEISESERERILDSIIALEDLFQNGEISEKSYKKKRQELKDQLSSLVD
jgi:uncharacterized membrane protein